MIKTVKVVAKNDRLMDERKAVYSDRIFQIVTSFQSATIWLIENKGSHCYGIIWFCCVVV